MSLVRGGNDILDSCGGGNDILGPFPRKGSEPVEIPDSCDSAGNPLPVQFLYYPSLKGPVEAKKGPLAAHAAGGQGPVDSAQHVI